MCFRAVLPGGGWHGWQPLIAHLAVTKWQNASQVSWQVTVAMAADSCNRAMVTALVFLLRGAVGGGSVEMAVSVWRWILNFVIFYYIFVLFGLICSTCLYIRPIPCGFSPQLLLLFQLTIPLKIFAYVYFILTIPCHPVPPPTDGLGAVI
jgi:hypothetical protein